MASNLSCVGLDVADANELESLVDRVLPRAVDIGRFGKLRVVRWEDPSGARLILGVTRNDVPDLLPSFAGVPRARLRDLRMVNEEVAAAGVFDEDDEQLTGLSLEVEQRRLLPAGPAGDYSAALVALGVEVSVFASQEEFAHSDASLLSDEPSDTEPPAHYVENGWDWPPRLAASSFISYGVFGDESEATAHARMSGVVMSAERKSVQETGQAFIAAVVESAGMQLTVCLEDREVMPLPGGIIAGTVFMTASLDSVPASPLARRPRLLGGR